MRRATPIHRDTLLESVASLVMPVRSLFGTETEYAVTALDDAGAVLEVHGVAEGIFERATARPSLAGEESGVFLSNGARFYIDVGSHPEYASPETTNPWDAVRYALAGDRLTSEFAREAARCDPRVATLVVRKGNVDYAGQTTFGSHENYLHQRPPDALRPALVPHLVSRIVITGGGGFDPFNRKRARFVLSPRALFIRSLTNRSPIGEMPLVDDRAQPHATGYFRQHLVCADANRSHVSMFLRVGTTALVVALIDAGVACEELTLAEPLAALATVARDTTLRERLRLKSGDQLTALEIQHHYLRRVRAHRAVLPDWTDPVCDVWQDTLDRLAEGPDAVADRLDWAIKRAVYRDRSARRRAARRSVADSAGGPRPLFPWRLTRRWRAELCEIDLRFGQIEPPSLFDALDRAGVLRHRVAGVHLVERAARLPPADGRARIRGQVVARLAGQTVMAVCGWNSIRDITSQRTLDLSSPFADVEIWHDRPPQSGTRRLVRDLAYLAVSRPPGVAAEAIRSAADALCAAIGAPPGEGNVTVDDAILLNNHAVSMRDAGRLDEAESLMRAALAIDVAIRPAGHPKLRHRRNNLAAVLLLRGRIDEARREVTRAWSETGSQYDVTSARILTVRLAIALVDGEPAALFAGQLKNLLAIDPMPDYAGVDRQWRLDRMLALLTSRLEADSIALLRAIGDIANGQRPLHGLETLPMWRDASSRSLDEPWPAVTGS